MTCVFKSDITYGVLVVPSSTWHCIHQSTAGPIATACFPCQTLSQTDGDLVASAAFEVVFLDVMQPFTYQV